MRAHISVWRFSHVTLFLLSPFFFPLYFVVKCESGFWNSGRFERKIQNVVWTAAETLGVPHHLEDGAAGKHLLSVFSPLGGTKSLTPASGR